MDKAIPTNQNGCKRLREQTILTTEKYDLWQHSVGIGGSLQIALLASKNQMQKISKGIKSILVV